MRYAITGMILLLCAGCHDANARVPISREGPGNPGDADNLQMLVNEGGTIYLEARRYVFDKPVRIKKAGTRIIGAGRRNTQIECQGVSGFIITADTPWDIEISDLEMWDSVRDRDDTIGIHFLNYPRYCTLRDLRMTGFTAWEIVINGGLGTVLRDIYLSRTSRIGGGIKILAHSSDGPATTTTIDRIRIGSNLGTDPGIHLSDVHGISIRDITIEENLPPEIDELDTLAFLAERCGNIQLFNYNAEQHESGAIIFQNCWQVKVSGGTTIAPEYPGSSGIQENIISSGEFTQF